MTTRNPTRIARIIRQKAILGVSLSVSVAMAGLALTADAAPVSITNHSFEVGISNPAAGWTDPGAVQTGSFATGSASDGANALFAFAGTTFQSLAETYVAGGTYTMSVDVIDRPGQSTGWDFGLYYDDGGLQPVVTTTGAYGGGGFVQQDAMITVNAGDAWEGENIVVALNRSGASSSSDWYDNVRLDAVVPPAIPEPSTFVLSALGFLGLMGARRRRRRR